MDVLSLITQRIPDGGRCALVVPEVNGEGFEGTQRANS